MTNFLRRFNRDEAKDLLAAHLGVPREVIHQWWDGIIPQPETHKLIVDSFRCSASELVGPKGCVKRYHLFLIHDETRYMSIVAGISSIVRYHGTPEKAHKATGVSLDALEKRCNHAMFHEMESIAKAAFWVRGDCDIHLNRSDIRKIDRLSEQRNTTVSDVVSSLISESLLERA